MNISILTLNLFWMSFNIILASIPVYISYYLYKKKKFKNSAQKYSLILLWVLFVPNTIYIITDIIHFPLQLLYVDGIYILILLFEYIVFIPLAFITYYLSFSFFEAFLVKSKRYNKYLFLIIFILNMLISLGLWLGRIQRTHSWYVFTNPLGVIKDILLLLSNTHYVLAILVFGIALNLFYFFLKNKIKVI